MSLSQADDGPESGLTEDKGPSIQFQKTPESCTLGPLKRHNAFWSEFELRKLATAQMPLRLAVIRFSPDC